MTTTKITSPAERESDATCRRDDLQAAAADMEMTTRQLTNWLRQGGLSQNEIDSWVAGAAL